MANVNLPANFDPTEFDKNARTNSLTINSFGTPPFSMADKFDGKIGVATLTGIISGATDASASPGFATINLWAGKQAFPVGASQLVAQSSKVDSSTKVFAMLQGTNAGLTTLLSAVPAAQKAAVIVTYAGIMAGGSARVVIGGVTYTAPFNTSNDQTVADLATAAAADPLTDVTANLGVLSVVDKTAGASGNLITLTATTLVNGTATVTSTAVTGSTAATGFLQNGGNLLFIGNSAATSTAAPVAWFLME